MAQPSNRHPSKLQKKSNEQHLHLEELHLLQSDKYRGGGALSPSDLCGETLWPSPGNGRRGFPNLNLYEYMKSFFPKKKIGEGQSCLVITRGHKQTHSRGWVKLVWETSSRKKKQSSQRIKSISNHINCTMYKVGPTPVPGKNNPSCLRPGAPYLHKLRKISPPKKKTSHAGRHRLLIYRCWNTGFEKGHIWKY